jgi:hypothetical protein
MKTLKTLTFAALVLTMAVFVAPAQERSMADATYALKGPVRSFRIEVATFVLKDGNYVEGPRVVQSEASFNTDGNRTDYYIYNKGVLGRRIEMKFDGRKMTECINYDGAGRVWLRTVTAYDNDGRIKENVNYNGDGSLRSKETFKRNTKGQLIESTEYSAAGVLLEQFTYKYEGPKVQSWERKIFGQDGVLQFLEVYIAPNKKEMTDYRPDGSIAAKSVRVGQEIAYYNADGSLQKFTTISDQGRLLDDLNLKQKDAPSRDSQIPDDVDTHGNWTKQTKWHTDANGTTPMTVTYRAFTYYDK